MGKDCITIVMPIHNGATTLEEVFTSLDSQNDKDLVAKVVLVDDASRDVSLEMASQYMTRASYKIQVVVHEKPVGLAATYNEALERVESTYILFMHQDMVLPDPHSFNKVMFPFMKDKNLVATYPTILHPVNVWRTYNFWQQALLCRFVGKKIPMLTGKFDCFQRHLLLEKVGVFDAEHFRTAGEDSDLKKRIIRAGLKITPSNVEVVHVHSRDAYFSLRSLFKKEAQIAEAQGVVYRKHSPDSLREFVVVFFRPLLCMSLLVPYVRYLSFLFILAYAFLYCWRMYYRPTSWKVFCLPFINIFLLFSATFYSFKGFFLGKQRL